MSGGAAIPAQNHPNNQANGPSNHSVQSSLSKSRQRGKEKFGSTVPDNMMSDYIDVSSGPKQMVTDRKIIGGNASKHHKNQGGQLIP